MAIFAPVRTFGLATLSQVLQTWKLFYTWKGPVTLDGEYDLRITLTCLRGLRATIKSSPDGLDHLEQGRDARGGTIALKRDEIEACGHREMGANR